MPVFAFEAMNKKGQKVRKEIDATSRDEAISKIKGMGFHPTAIKQRAAASAKGKSARSSAKASSRRASQRKSAALPKIGMSGGSTKSTKLIFGRVNLSELSQFTNQLSTLQDAGLPIVRSLRILEGQLKVSVLKNTLGDVAGEVESGSSLSDALGKHPKVFDRLYVNMIKAGELGGVLDTILDRLATFMEKSLRLRKKVIGAMVYPVVVSFIAVSILIAIMKFVVPKFIDLFAEQKLTLPLPTQMLQSLSSFIENQFWILLILPFVFYLIYWAIARTPRGRFNIDKFKLYMPVFGTIMRKSIVARFCRTLGTLIASGVPILDALSIVKEATGNEVITRAVDDVHSSIKEGESIARPLAASGVFDDIIVNMVDIGEETGELDKMLMKVADNYDSDVDVAVEALTSVMEPILIVFMGGAVAFIVIALFMPMITLLDAIK